MIIVEFCGTPGCGKSTVCDSMQKSLQQMGYSVQNLQHVSEAITVFQKIKRKLWQFYYRHAKCNKKIRSLLAILETNSNGVINWKDRILEVNGKIHLAEKKGIQIGLLDEGFLQFITSLYHGHKIKNDVEPLIDCLLKDIYRERTRIVNCELDLEENYRRLKGRNKEGDRFLAADDEQNKEALLLKRENIEYVLAHVPEKMIYSMNMENSQKELKDLLVQIERNVKK